MTDPLAGVLEVACDESGNDGERLIGGTGPVFVHGSHDLTLDESAEIMRWLRAETGSRAPEFKFKQLARRGDPQVFAELFNERLSGRSNVNLSEKTYFIVGKVVDLLVEELKHARGEDFYAGGKARTMALKFYREGERALGKSQWTGLLDSFNSLMRVNPGKHGAKATIDDFFEAVEAARWTSRRRNVSEALGLVRAARDHAESFQSSLEDSILPALDPLIPSIAQVARHWFELRRKPIQILHDQTNTLSPRAVEAIVGGIRHPGEFAKMAPPVNIAGINLHVSSADERIQVADIIAGFGKRVAEAALAGNPDRVELQLLIPMVNPESVWGDELSWKLLSNRA